LVVIVKPKVPVLITWDVDPDPWIEREKRVQAFNNARALCDELDIHATFFITAQPAEMYAAEIAPMMARGHEIGCHGWTHGDEENYDLMPEAKQHDYIGRASDKLQSLTGQPIRVFRSPRVKTSALTMRLLVEHGYLADSTVCSQRMDLISSNLINTNWLFAPRRPYHPRLDHAYRAGSLPLWQIPVSALLLPFISSAHSVLGAWAMKIFFRVLYTESKITGKPIVYLAHPTEFRNRKGGNKGRFREYVQFRYFAPSFIRTHGFRPRNLLYRVNGSDLLNSTRNLFRYMASFSDVAFVTVSEYVGQYLDGDIVAERTQKL
jgi:peptidoglycan/xylan/chitin deacetylase (PgdA/CDA1 family)